MFPGPRLSRSMGHFPLLRPFRRRANEESARSDPQLSGYTLLRHLPRDRLCSLRVRPYCIAFPCRTSRGEEMSAMPNDNPCCTPWLPLAAIGVANAHSCLPLAPDLLLAIGAQDPASMKSGPSEELFPAMSLLSSRRGEQARSAH